MEMTECSETSTRKIQTPGNHLPPPQKKENKTKLKFGKLLIAEWNQTATFGNNNARYSACALCQCDPRKIHDHAFAVSDRAADESSSTAAVEGAVNIKKQ